jgi:hypothetical protein
MQQRHCLCAVLAAIVCAGLASGAVRAQLYKGSENCVAGGRCCYGFANDPDQICGTLEEIQSAAMRCDLYIKTLIDPPGKLTWKCQDLKNAAGAIEAIQRLNAKQQVEREQARKLLDQLNR